MNITLEIPDEMGPQLAGIDNPNAFILSALKTALENKPSGVAGQESVGVAPVKHNLKTLLASWTPYG